MARLVICKRRIDMATDDLPFPIILIIIPRLVWVCLVVVLLSMLQFNPYIFFNLSLHILLLFNEIFTVHVSMSGTVCNEKPRYCINFCCHIEIFLLAIDWAFQCYSLFIPHPAILHIVIIWSLILDSLFFIVLATLFALSVPPRKNSDMKNFVQLWKRRVEWFLSSPEKVERNGDSQKTITKIAALLSRFFKDVDWAPSDMAVGLLLLKREQKIMRTLTELRKRYPIRSSFWEGFSALDSCAFDSDSDADSDLDNIHLGVGLFDKKRETFSPKDRPIPIDSDPCSSKHHAELNLNAMDAMPKSSLLDSNATLPEQLDSSNPEISNHSILPEDDNTFPNSQESASEFKMTINDYSSRDAISDPSKLAIDFKIKDHAEKSPRRRKNSLFQFFDMHILNRKGKQDSEEQVELSNHVVVSRKSEVFQRQTQPNSPPLRSRSMSLSRSGQHFKRNPKAPHEDWSFASYAFNLSADAKEIKRPDILDAIHFCHYANMAYVKLDNEIQKKTDILLHYSPLNDLFQVPYLVSLDHDWNSIVIAIRGTFSTSDWLVDLSLDFCLLDSDLPNPEQYLVHSGIFRSAMNIYNDIVQTGILEKSMDPSLRESSYHIVVCGHSLGAGIASIVAYYLRKRGYIRTMCYGYSMPSMCGEMAASLFNDFCLSIVCGDDLISRLSVRAAEVLKRDVSRLLNQCNLPKYKIFGSAIANRFKIFALPEKRANLLQRTQNGMIPDGTDERLQESEIERILSNTGSLPKRWREGSRNPVLLSATETLAIPSFIPGRILYIEKIRISEPIRKKNVDLDSKRKRGMASLEKVKDAMAERFYIAKHVSFDSKYVYIPRWADKEEFLEIIVSRTMVRDHLAIFGIMKEFDSIDPEESLAVLS